MTMGGTYYICDLDGSLCDSGHRNSLAQAKQWDEFHSLCGHDTPHGDVLALIHNLHYTNLHLLVVTGRNRRFEGITLDWFRRYKVVPDAMLMRPDGDFTPDIELKVNLLEEFFGSKERVLDGVCFALEDRDKVVEALRNYGIPTWQVRSGAY